MRIDRQASGALLVADGFVSLEGPVVDATGDLHVADLRAGGVHRVRRDGTHDVVVADRPRIGGIGLHAAGGIVVSGLSVDHIRDGEATVLLDLGDLSARSGTVATGFNDILADSQGRIIAGVLRQDAGGQHVPGELVRISAPHVFEVLHTDLYPNGLAWSPDDGRLYAADTFRRRLITFDATGDRPIEVGTISTEAIPGFPDGIATDEAGGVWVAFYRGACVARVDPTGTSALVMEVPSLKPLSVCFDVVDATTLYVVTGRSEPDAADTGSIYRITTAYQGTPVHLASI